MNFQKKMSSGWVGVGALIGANLWVSLALAGDVTVRVRDQLSGNLLSGVSVCVGSGANPSQFGAVLTDSSGQAYFSDIPRTSLLLTASAQAYNPLQRGFLGQNNKSIQIIRLQPGNRSGPRCSARNESDTARSALRITSFSLAGGAARTRDRSVAIDTRFEGEASEYRISERADFENAVWKKLQPGEKFELGSSMGNKKVFFQLRRVLLAAGASLQVTSNTVSDTIYLAK